MAMSCVIRKASPTVIPLALRAISSPRINLTGSFPSEKEASFFSNQFSSAAAVDNNKKFVKALRSQIKLAKLLDSKKRVLPTPTDFPFTIKDNLGDDTIFLERMLHGENVRVIVTMPSDIEEDEEELDSDVSSSDDDNDDVGDNDSLSTTTSELEEEEKSITTSAPTVPMRLIITKENGGAVLDISILATSNEIIVKNVTIFKSSSSYEYSEGPKFETLASDLQHSLKKFIKSRGIEESHVEFLYKYMVRKSKREEMFWMEELKKFVKK